MKKVIHIHVSFLADYTINIGGEGELTILFVYLFFCYWNETKTIPPNCSLAKMKEGSTKRVSCGNGVILKM